MLISIIASTKNRITKLINKYGGLFFPLSLLFKLMYNNTPESNIGITLPANF